MGKQWNSDRVHFLQNLQNHYRVTIDLKLKDACSLKEKLYKSRQCSKKQRHCFANKGPSTQGYGFTSSHVWLWELDYKESWAPRIDSFELWCWRRLLRVAWTARRSNQSILKEISPEYSSKRLMLKLQFFGHLMRWADSLENTLMMGKIEAGGEGDVRGWNGWIASLTQ